MYKNIKVFTLKELLIIGVGSVCMRILNKLGFWHKYLPLKKEVDFLTKEEFNVIRQNKYWCIENNRWGRIQIRPQTSDVKVVKQVLVDKEYMPLVNLITEYVSSEDIFLIIDAGANIGLTTIFFKKHFQKAKIIAIEPDSNNAQLLNENIRINNLSKSVKIIKKALWKSSGDILELSNDFRDGDFWSKSVKEIPPTEVMKNMVESIKLRDIFDLSAKKQIDILKIDIEGAESILFEDSEFIKMIKTHVRFLCIEIHNEFDCKKRIETKLKDIGYMISENGETTFCVNENIHNH